MRRKTLAIIIAMTLLFISIIPLIDKDSAVNAYTDKTRDEAIDWVQSQIGTGIDYDGVYGNQCVDLIKAYYHYLGVDAVRGNGKDYADNALPDGWSRVQGGIPEKGDIIVYGASASNEYGHVAIYESDYETYHQNFNGHGYVEKVTAYRYTGLSNTYWGYIRPDWVDSNEPIEPPTIPGNVRTTDGKTLYTTGDFIKFVWDASKRADSYYIQMMKGDDELYSADVGKLKSYTASPLEEGGYTFVVRAVNSLGYSEAAIEEFEVNDSPEEPWWKIDRNTIITEVHAVKEQASVGFVVPIEMRYTNHARKLRADWYAGYSGKITSDTPVFCEEKNGDENANSFIYTLPLSTDAGAYDTFQCIIRELSVNDEAETTVRSEVAFFSIIIEGEPADTESSESAEQRQNEKVADVIPVKKTVSVVPKESRDLKAVKIKNVRAAKKRATVSWKKLKKKERHRIQGIEVQWSPDKFKTIAGTKKVKKSKSSLAIKGLNSGKKYWIRIRAYKIINGIKHVSSWKTKTVRIK